MEEQEKELYLIITYFKPGGCDVSRYDTLEEAIDDYDPLNWKQELYKVERIFP